MTSHETSTTTTATPTPTTNTAVHATYETATTPERPDRVAHTHHVIAPPTPIPAQSEAKLTTPTTTTGSSNTVTTAIRQDQEELAVRREEEQAEKEGVREQEVDTGEQEKTQSEVRAPAPSSTAHLAFDPRLHEPTRFDWAAEVDEALGLSPVALSDCAAPTPVNPDPGDVMVDPVRTAFANAVPADTVHVDPAPVSLFNLVLNNVTVDPDRTAHGSAVPANSIPAPTNPVPTDPAPVNPTPVSPINRVHTAFVNAAPTDSVPVPTSPVPVDPDPDPVSPVPTKPAPANPITVDPVRTVPVDLDPDPANPSSVATDNCTPSSNTGVAFANPVPTNHISADFAQVLRTPAAPINVPNEHTRASVVPPTMTSSVPVDSAPVARVTPSPVILTDCTPVCPAFARAMPADPVPVDPAPISAKLALVNFIYVKPEPFVLANPIDPSFADMDCIIPVHINPVCQTHSLGCPSRICIEILVGHGLWTLLLLFWWS